MVIGRPVMVSTLCLGAMLLAACGNTSTAPTAALSAVPHSPNRRSATASAHTGLSGTRPARVGIVWNRQGPIPPPRNALTVAHLAATSPGWVVTDQFRAGGFAVAGAQAIGHPGQGALLLARGARHLVYTLPDGTGAAVIVAWNASNAQGRAVAPSSVDFITLHGITGSINIAHMTITTAKPEPYNAFAASEEHLPKNTWGDGDWYSVKTGLFGPQVVSVLNRGTRASVWLTRINDFSHANEHFIIPGSASGVHIVRINTVGTLLTLEGNRLHGTLNLLTGHWVAQ